MALSSVHDVANPKHASNGNAQTDGCEDVETNKNTDKVRDIQEFGLPPLSAKENVLYIISVPMHSTRPQLKLSL